MEGKELVEEMLLEVGPGEEHDCHLTHLQVEKTGVAAPTVCQLLLHPDNVVEVVVCLILWYHQHSVSVLFHQILAVLYPIHVFYSPTQISAP